MNDYNVRGRVFRTGNDYQAALRDDKKIEILYEREIGRNFDQYD